MQSMSPGNTKKLHNQDNVVLKNEVTVKVEPSRLLHQLRGIHFRRALNQQDVQLHLSVT